jgi:N6-L-threonylcarbamoyladenine synthase
MIILAIETSCDETAVAVLEGHGDSLTVRANIISSQIALHAQYGGVVPALAAREHAANIQHVLEAALKEAGITDGQHQIDLIAVTRGPGLGPALLVGLMFARTLAWMWDKPLIGVDHMDGHVHSNWLERETPIAFPALNLIVSGGHTDLVLMTSHASYNIIGETRDDAIGEAFDKVARLLDLGYPGGPKISSLAEQGNPTRYNLPRPMLDAPNFDFSYSGLKTAVLYLIQDLTKEHSTLTAQQKADIAASFQEAAIDVLIQKTRRAAQSLGVSSILLSGGVSANKLLRARVEALGAELGVAAYIPAMKYTTDNAAMIGAAAYFAHQANPSANHPWQDVAMDANMRLC